MNKFNSCEPESFLSLNEQHEACLKTKSEETIDVLQAVPSVNELAKPLAPDLNSVHANDEKQHLDSTAVCFIDA